MTGVVALSLVAAACGGGDVPSSGSWLLVSVVESGEAVEVDRPLFLDVDGETFSAETTCNRLSGEFGAEIRQTAMGCNDEAHRVEGLIAVALRGDSTERDGVLVFDAGDVRVTYEAYVEPSPSALFAILDDPALAVDSSVLPDEQATGSVPPRFGSLVALPSPIDGVQLFVAEVDGLVCLVWSTPDSASQQCDRPRVAEAIAIVGAVRLDGGTRAVALVPDRFADAAAQRIDLGAFDTDILVLDNAALGNSHELIAADGSTLRIRS